MIMQVLLIKINDVYSLHRDFLEMTGCTMHCSVMLGCNVMLMDVNY